MIVVGETKYGTLYFLSTKMEENYNILNEIFWEFILKN